MRNAFLILILALNCTRTFPGSYADAESLALAARLLTQTQSSASSAAAGPSCASSAFCYTFRTNGLPSANLGGISGADATCNSDGNKPGAAIGTFKALIVDPQNNMRRASVTGNVGDGQIDWVLQANKQYRRSDGLTTVATSNAARLFTFAMASSFVTGAGGHWSGLSATWTNDAVHCTGWTNTGGTGRDGADNAPTSAAIFNNATLCNTAGPTLICIEQ